MRINETCVRAIDGRIPVVAGIAGLATAECVALARAAERAGCDGIMALPAYVYHSDWRETREHYGAIIDATPLSCMLYNNPIAYRTDVLPEQLAELAQRYDNLHAVKESSGDVRRVTAVRERLGDRLAVFAGLDDMILEAIAMGAIGWVAGLVNALPEESVQLVELARAGRWDEATALYHWFLPLLRMDTVPKFVQLIKLVQAQVGRGTETVRPPRLVLEGAEREAAVALIADRLGCRPVRSARSSCRADFSRRSVGLTSSRRSAASIPCVVADGLTRCEPRETAASLLLRPYAPPPGTLAALRSHEGIHGARRNSAHPKRRRTPLPSGDGVHPCWVRSVPRRPVSVLGRDGSVAALRRWRCGATVPAS